ncbi:MAG TPA: hypothetical protein DCX46_13810 [Bacteroidetes bacterium]|nr:hypothetical protein [Bacteroidota bacterium]
MKPLQQIAICLFLILLITSAGFSQGQIVVSRNKPVSIYLTGPVSHNSNSSIVKLTDGITSASNFYEILPGNEGSRILIELGESFPLSRFQVRTFLSSAFEMRLRGYEARVSVDGVNWTLVAADSSVDTTTIDVLLPPVQARFFEVTITRMSTGVAGYSTVLGEISLWADIDRPTVTSVSVGPHSSDTSQYRTITWVCSQWDTGKTVTILAGSDRQTLNTVAANIPNSSSYPWRTSIVPDGPTIVQVVPDTMVRYTGETIVTIANYYSLFAEVDIPLSYDYEPRFPILYSTVLGDTIRFSWTYQARFPNYDAQEIRFSSDSGATWETVFAVPDTSIRNIAVAVSQLSAGGERCFLGLTVLMGNTRMVTIKHKLPLHIAQPPAFSQSHWSASSSTNSDTFLSSELPTKRGLVGYPLPNNHWRIIGGLGWLLDENGNSLGSWNISLPLSNSVAAGDVDLDGVTDIVPYWFYQNSALDYVPYVLPDTGSLPSGNYPYYVAPGDFQLIDVDGDDSLEVAYSSYGNVSLYRARGDFFRQYSWMSTLGTFGRFFDVVGSPLPDLVVPSGSTLSVFDSVGQAFLDFPATFATTFIGSPLPFDADGDGTQEIIAYGYSQMYCVTSAGTVAPGFPVSFQGSLVSGPSIGDVDADGSLDIVIVLNRNQQYEVRCYNSHGSLLTGWPRIVPLSSPVYTTAPYYGDTVLTVLNALPAQPLIASIDGDQECEILVSTANGRLYIFNADGSDFDGSPLFIGNYTPEAGILGDFDADGAIEYAYPIFQEYPARHSIACLEFTPGSYNANAIPWPMYLADATKSGRANSAVVVGVNEKSTLTVPDHFSLSQNYPNPFNPSTTIRYDLPRGVHTTVRVLNILGQSVATLVDEFQQSGTHVARFDGTHLASGVYFVHITAGANRSSRKMLFMK